MAKNVILMIGDGMGWEMTRARAIQAEIEQEIAEIRESNPNITNEEIASRFDGRSLDDYYTEARGSGTSYQDLEGYAIATTGNTYIDGDKSNSALQTNPKVKVDVFNHNTGQAALRKGFKFNPNASVVKGFEENPRNLAPTSEVE
jgi:alkaline phosphatase